MNVFEIPGTNMTLAEGQDEYLNLPIRAEHVNVITNDGSVEAVPCMTSAWKPDRTDLAILLNGGHIELTVLGHKHPPVMLNVEHGPD